MMAARQKKSAARFEQVMIFWARLTNLVFDHAESPDYGTVNENIMSSRTLLHLHGVICDDSGTTRFGNADASVCT